ncbi:MAG: DNA/RNA-binding protein AlbA/Ssh10b [Candidatus Alkanophagales archaeon MCA70_species_1]|nr:DNA/RNA-binding protein AlbA/Ssh10b [Candidatus Alkanophaga volatiphilum]
MAVTEAGENMPEDNVIYVGNKPVMSYVLAVVTQFNNGSEEVVIKARGRSISRAVDTAEVVRNKFMPNVEIRDIKISTEEIEGEGGQKANVSSIEIVLGLKR